MSNEVKVGIFVVFIFIIFVVLSVKIGELNLSKKGTYPFTMVFPTVEGLNISSNIELAGVNVGKVTGIMLNKDYTAVVTAALNEDIKLPIDSTASIGTKGVLGDRIIILSPGVSKNYIDPGGNLARTKVPPSMDTLLMQVGELASNLTQLSASLTTAFGDQETMRDIVVNLRDLSANTSSLVAENKDNISDILTNMREITNNFTVVSQNLTSTSKNIDEMVGTINSGQGSLGKLVTDETLYNSMVDFMESAQLVMDRVNGDGTLGLLMSDSTLYYNLADTTKNLKVITDELASGKGTLGHLLTDEELYTNLNEAIQSANRAAQGLEEQTPISVMGTILGLVW